MKKEIPGLIGYYATERGLIERPDGKFTDGHIRNGYKAITIEGQSYYIHRLVNMAFNGVPNLNEVTNHINGDKLDNRPDNLEWVTYRDNSLHYTKGTNKTSQYPGVSFNKKSGKWRAQVRINGIKKNLGYFKTVLEAYNAYLDSLSEENETSKYSQIPQQSLLNRIISRIWQR